MLRNPNYVYGPRDVQLPMRLNFGEFMLNRFLAHGDKTAIVNENTNASVTYKQLCQKSTNAAVSLARLGVRKGDVVAICSENRLEVWSAVVGVTCTGAVMTPLNMGYTPGELTHVLNISKPSYIIASPTCYKNYEKTFTSLDFVKKIITFGNDGIPNTIPFNDLIREDIGIEDLEVPDVVGQTDTLFILYSSGTTGLPKGVMLTHLAVITTLLLPSMQDGGEATTPASITVTPWFHAMGLMMFLSNLAQGTMMVTLNRFELDLYMRTIEKYRPTRLTTVPPMLIALTKSDAKYDMSSVQYVMCGAAPLPADIMPAIKARFPNVKALIQGYGMTENTLAVSKDFSDGRSTKHGSVGPVVSGCVVKVVDLETRKPLGPRQQGEFCIKSVTMMKGYIGKDMKDDFDEEGFFKTGDIGYYDEDGYLYIVDRLKELIKYKANQVAPAEIEAVLLQHDAVRDVGVVGQPHPSCGEVPLAFVVMQPGRTVSEEELKDFVAERLSNAKHLRGGVRFVSEIPKNPSGKILRRQLKTLLNETKSKL